MVLHYQLYKIIVLVAFLSPFSTDAFSFKNLSPYRYLDKTLCDYWGGEGASPLYQETARHFLASLGVKHSEFVPIRKLNDQAALRHSGSYALTRPTGIWINEHKLPVDNSLTSLQLYVIAHEASNFAFQHKRILLLLALSQSYPCLVGIEAIANIAIALFSLNKVAHWAAEDPAWIRTNNFNISITLLTFAHGFVATTCGKFLNDMVLLFGIKFSRKLEKEADLHAAELLYKLDYSYVIEEYIEQLKEDLDKGISKSVMHPPVEEEIEYLQNFLDIKKKWQ